MKKAVVLLFYCFTLQFLHAQTYLEKPDFKRWQIRARGVGVVPNESAEKNKINLGVNMSSTFVPEVDITYFFTKNMAAELAISTSKHKLSTLDPYLAGITGSTDGTVDLGQVRIFPPSLLLQYYFYPTTRWTPYVGVGINHTSFYKSDPGVVKDISFKNSFGTALQLGVDLHLSPNCFFNLDIKQSFLKTETQINAANYAPNNIFDVKTKLNPFFLGFGFGIKL